jgi:hypothetical protein
MDKEEKSPANKDQGNNKTNQGQAGTTPLLKGNSQEQEKTEEPRNKPRNNIKHHLSRLIPRKNTARGLAIWLNIAMLIAFIILGWRQGCQTRRAIDMANTANSYTKKSIDYTRETDSIKKWNDSVDRVRAQRTVDANYKLTKQGIDISERSATNTYDIAKKTMRAQIENSQNELRAYVVVTNIDPIYLRVNKQISISYTATNMGKTPSNNSIAFSKFLLRDKADTIEIGKGYKQLRESIDRHDKGGWVMGVNFPLNKEFKSDFIYNAYDSICFYKNMSYMCLLIGIRYYDFFGRKHYTMQCLFYDTLGHFTPYTSYNWMN